MPHSLTIIRSIVKKRISQPSTAPHTSLFPILPWVPHPQCDLHPWPELSGGSPPPPFVSHAGGRAAPCSAPPLPFASIAGSRAGPSSAPPLLPIR